MDIEQLIENILKEIVGKENVKKSNIIKKNSYNLSECGDLSFSINLLAWKELLSKENSFSVEKNVKNILEYYLKNNNINIDNYSNDKILKEALELLIFNSQYWLFKLQKGFLNKEKVCLHLNRSSIISAVIKETLKLNDKYGTVSDEINAYEQLNKTVLLDINEDVDSNLTTCRLKLLKGICDNIFFLHKYKIKNTKNEENNEIIDYKYLLTTKSQGKLKKEYKKYICGVVKNFKTKSKETKLTYDTYIQKKIKDIKEINGYRQLGIDKKLLEKDYQITAEAIVVFEFFSIKPSHSVIITTDSEVDKCMINNKGGAFILYNNARISAILDKYEEDKLAGKYPVLWNIHQVNFNQLNLEEEWELVYNFIVKYPTIILDLIKFKTQHELFPQNICSFLFHLSQKFSIYYRRFRILTEGCAHLIPTLMARLYLLKALQIVYNNALNILNITPISRM